MQPACCGAGAAPQQQVTNIHHRQGLLPYGTKALSLLHKNPRKGRRVACVHSMQAPGSAKVIHAGWIAAAHTAFAADQHTGWLARQIQASCTTEQSLMACMQQHLPTAASGYPTPTSIYDHHRRDRCKKAHGGSLVPRTATRRELNRQTTCCCRHCEKSQQPSAPAAQTLLMPLRFASYACIPNDTMWTHNPQPHPTPTSWLHLHGPCPPAATDTAVGSQKVPPAVKLRRQVVLGQVVQETQRNDCAQVAQNGLKL